MAAYTNNQHDAWVDLQMRKAKALADLTAAVCVEPPDLVPPDPAATATIARVAAEVQSLKTDHTGMTRAEYRDAIQARGREIAAAKAVLARAEAGNDLKVASAKEAHLTARRKAEQAYREIVDEEIAAFGFVTGGLEGGLDVS